MSYTITSASDGFGFIGYLLAEFETLDALTAELDEIIDKYGSVIVSRR